MAGDEADDSGTSKPNVIFIMIDDMGWNDIGYQSTDLADVTPNLDRLASLGVKVNESASRVADSSVSVNR